MGKAFALVGKPNSGKSTLFNLLTGLNQKVGNYAGVTVEKRTGNFEGNSIQDLPGLRSLRVNTEDERISRDEIFDCVDTGRALIFIANGLQLEDNLTLFTEIADLQVPMILVINFKDELERSNVKIDVKKLSDHLGAPVVAMNSKNGDGLDELTSILRSWNFSTPNTFCRSSFDQFEGDQFVNKYRQVLLSPGSDFNTDSFKEFYFDYSQRQLLVSSLMQSVSSTEAEVDLLMKKSRKADRFLLHPIFGLLTFVLVLFLLFQAVFALATYPMDWIDGLFGFLSEWSNENVPIGWLADLISNGILPGLSGVLIFIPQIAILFFLLGVLEHSGYMSRISVISDRFLRKFGLSGKSVVPLMSSWACAIPAIMSTRAIDDSKERMAVIMAAPLMTCSARLPVYTILIAVLFPMTGEGLFNTQGMVLFGLYLLGLLATLGVAYLASRKVKSQGNAVWTMELPNYRVPNWRSVFTNVYNKTMSFVMQAGKIIFFISILLWLLASFSPKNEDFLKQEYQSMLVKDPTISQAAVDLEYSYAGYLGKLIEPAIRPLGYDWKIGIALITSFAAREVFVGTLATIYSIGSEEEDSVIERLKKEKNRHTGAPQFNMATSISLLLFYVFALQCMSTVAIVRKETDSWPFALGQFVLMFLMAYGSALLAYQFLS